MIKIKAETAAEIHALLNTDEIATNRAALLLAQAALKGYVPNPTGDLAVDAVQAIQSRQQFSLPPAPAASHFHSLSPTQQGYQQIYLPPPPPATGLVLPPPPPPEPASCVPATVVEEKGGFSVGFLLCVVVVVMAGVVGGTLIKSPAALGGLLKDLPGLPLPVDFPPPPPSADTPPPNVDSPVPPEGTPVG